MSGFFVGVAGRFPFAFSYAGRAECKKRLRRGKPGMKKPEIDIGECVLCDICVDLCPGLFVKNDAGYIEVTDALDCCTVEDIRDVIKNCRGNCISWDEETETQGV